MQITGRVISGEWGRMGEKAQGIRSLNGRKKNSQGEVKNTIGNGEAKELRCMTHGHELRGVEGNKREKEMGPL